MITQADPSLAELDAIEDALDAMRQDPFAAEEPPEGDYPYEEADRRYVEHCAAAHGGQHCTCQVILNDESPF